MPPELKADLPQRDSRDARDRSPHPYARKGSVSQLKHNHESFPINDSQTGKENRFTTGFSTPVTANYHNEQRHHRERETSASYTATSESGTEADDENERPQFLKALPPPLLRPRKGLKGDALLDGTSTPLLTPAELDRDDKRTSLDYFQKRDGKLKGKQEPVPAEADVLAARVLFEKRRRAERVRRISEGVLLGVIGATVVSGPSVWSHLWCWNRGETLSREILVEKGHHHSCTAVELLSQILTVAFLIAMYPLRVLSVSRKDIDKGLATHGTSLLGRFRVPASFDPASILYPTFLPVLVALALLPQFPALLLPNLILGLASLPPRLFPATSRLVDINTLGWMVTIVPLVASEHTKLPLGRFPPTPYMLKAEGAHFLHPEIMVLLYPLHQALLPPLHHLTTTSLLAAEKHLLATGLVNLLCFAISPQASILRALLWVGGVWMLVTCTNVLNWNVTLARVPRWRFRTTRYGKSSTVEALMLALWELVIPRKQHQEDSDADEDNEPPPRRDSKFLRPQSTFNSFLNADEIQEPKSALEASPGETLDLISAFTGAARKRRHTIATVDDPASLFAETKISKQRRLRSWYLEITPEGAMLRKWLYSGWVYTAIICIILVPVRMAVSRHALNGAEPIIWGINYVFADIMELFYAQDTLTDSLNAYLEHTKNAALYHLSWHNFSIPALRLAVGEANTRLLLAAYWVVVVGLGIATVTTLAPRIEVDTRRKIFHATIVTMLLPTTFIDPCFCALALSIVLAVFLLLEVIRAGQVPPLGAAIGRFVAPYVDGRDLRGPMVVSHVFLLIGCAIPLWLSASGLDRSTHARWPGWEMENEVRDVAMIAGVVCVGMGDAAASLIGRRYGRRKWPWIGGKSLEGSAAFAVAVVIGLMGAKVWLHAGGWNEEPEKTRPTGTFSGSDERYWAMQMFKALICGCGASFMEAVLTGANDNVVVPIALWLLVRGVGI